MQPSLSQELRRAADSLLEFIKRQSPEITGTPRRIQVAYEAADEMERLKNKLDAALEDMKTLVRYQDSCEICKVERDTAACEESGYCCDGCKSKSHCTCGNCGCGDNFEWREPQEGQ